jgi:gluconolactonase
LILLVRRLFFEIVVDHYAEVWVAGKLTPALGQTGGQAIKGLNAPNRVLLTRDAKPGQQFQLAIFGINGAEGAGADIVRLAPPVDDIVPKDAIIEKLAGGFQFTEGPVWHHDGYLLFSDPNNNVIYRWSPDRQVSVFKTKSGYAGLDIGEYG